MDPSTQQFQNRLRAEKSPYLLLHGGNPVDWFPWGDEAFAKAKREQKPIFLSIGYATCHWCHVMAHESFEDADIARLLNDTFVCVKVDREERPDIDSLYMAVCQMLTGSGGWPLTILMTPDKAPFFAGTYFPKTSRFGRIGMIDLIPQVRHLWAHEREKALQTAQHILETLQTYHIKSAGSPENAPQADFALLNRAGHELTERFDRKYGGFSSAPKFPSPHTLMLLLRQWKRNGHAPLLGMIEQTLQAMRRGGIYDHLGFGFHRYSTDERWLLPHFEKMLYDQALLVLAYLEVYQATKKPEYAQTAREIFTYVLRDMTDPSGGLYSAEDADSEGVEGKFYVWSVEELRALLDAEDAEFALTLFSFEEAGNFYEQSTGQKTGENIIHLRQPLPNQECERFERIRQRLLETRKGRVHPLKDDKILTDWNGLMIAALAKGGQVLNEPIYTAAAERAAEFIFSTVSLPDGRLLHRYRDGEAAIAGHLDDYAFIIWGVIELYEATFEPKHLERALTLNQQVQAHFRDAAGGGYFLSANDAEPLPLRQKEGYDGAIPSGNSVMMLNLLRLARLTGHSEFETDAERLFRAFSGMAAQNPTAFAFLLTAADFALSPSHEIVIVGDIDAMETKQMLAALRAEFLPNAVILFRPANQDAPEILRLAPFIEPYQCITSKTTAYVCRNFACNLPVTELAELLKQLTAIS
ncbi:hypothetical protein U14_04963 [Candidatus Moduliflexus flocculans]|uniref:Spermatogenesis-associated protein 20-like TRX domain-containing protein n=1 Tax=Candidatus Moduliflexus flocculans TaxID=1499966 RepID=A0A081BQL1_9BACT|nr:hypothetical protein U14_04963 [Candidatus Moduliflexus flocculans]